ncbi:hypothetical protein Q8F55_004005 [Vanrija albida]|uniref:NAD-dependent epimerase/dehydratase domain-containing protein n=1 Tax=Vanrija albida TaxID=181172 RepID=A0ABR3Q5I7_9TREE
MKVLLTGASGYIGTHLTRLLIAQGHSVTGLVRSSGSAAVVTANGGTPVLITGDVPTDLPLIVAQASAHDATYHLAFDHTFADFPAACADERAVVEAVGAAYEHTAKVLVASSATMFGAHLAPLTEAHTTEGSANPRAGTEAAAEAWARKGNAVAIVRLPPITHGGGDLGGGAFIHRLIRAARAGGRAGVVGDGGNRWPSVHVADAVAVYAGALAAQPGQVLRLHPVAELNAIADIMGLVAAHDGLPLAHLSAEDVVEQYGFIGHLLGLDNEVATEITRARLGWAPTQPGLMDELRRGSYFDTA